MIWKANMWVKECVERTLRVCNEEIFREKLKNWKEENFFSLNFCDIEIFGGLKFRRLTQIDKLLFKGRILFNFFWIFSFFSFFINFYKFQDYFNKMSPLHTKLPCSNPQNRFSLFFHKCKFFPTIRRSRKIKEKAKRIRCGFTIQRWTLRKAK